MTVGYEKLHQLWEEFRTLTNEIDEDVIKSQKGILSAGVRSRKAMRHLQRLLRDAVKESVEFDKLKRAEKKARKTSENSDE